VVPVVRHYVIKTFGMEVLNMPAKEVQKLLVVEDIAGYKARKTENDAWKKLPKGRYR